MSSKMQRQTFLWNAWTLSIATSCNEKNAQQGTKEKIMNETLKQKVQLD